MPCTTFLWLAVLAVVILINTFTLVVLSRAVGRLTEAVKVSAGEFSSDVEESVSEWWG